MGNDDAARTWGASADDKRAWASHSKRGESDEPEAEPGITMPGTPQGTVYENPNEDQHDEDKSTGKSTSYRKGEQPTPGPGTQGEQEGAPGTSSQSVRSNEQANSPEGPGPGAAPNQ